MPTPIFLNSVSCVIDPTDHFSELDPVRLLEACAPIPYWIDVNASPSFQEQVDTKYCFGLFEIKGGTIDENGVYHYPEDPPLYPLAKWEVAYMYQHAIISFIKDGETFVTRVD